MMWVNRMRISILTTNAAKFLQGFLVTGSLRMIGTKTKFYPAVPLRPHANLIF